jgi:serine/alanine adding enzyme
MSSAAVNFMTRSMNSGTRALSVVPLDSERAWDEFVVNDPSSSFCHLSGWREIIDGVMGHECLYSVACDDAGQYVGLLPLAELRNPLFGTHRVSLPFLNYGGPIGTEGARTRLAALAHEQARAGDVTSLLLRNRHSLESAIPASGKKITVLLDLPPTADELWNQRFNAKFRNKIKRPQREGMETRFGLSHVDAFYEVFAHNMRDLGTPVLPREFFTRVAKMFPRLCVVGAVYWKERPVAAGWGFIWRDEFEMTWSSSLRDIGNLKPNMLLYWSFMEHLIGRGVRTFNFGRSTPGTGPHEFKESWGGVDVPLPWAEWPEAAGGDERTSTMMSTATAVWKRLPLPIANAIGPVVARTLPWW